MAKKDQNPRCPNCNGQSRKYGIRKNKLQELQQYRCKDCGKKFTLNQIKHKTYSINITLKAISNYNLGYTLEKSAKFVNQKFKIRITSKNVQLWVKEFQSQLPYSKMREKAKRLYSPEEIIEKHEFLHNNLPYKFQIHKAKLELLFKDIRYNNRFINQSKFYEPLKQYLEKITTNKFPHHIFKHHQSCPNAEIDKLKNKKILETNFSLKNNATSAEGQHTTTFTTKEAEATSTIEAQSSDAEIEKNKKIISNKNNEQRASQIKFNHLKIKKTKKQNMANKLAKLALQTASSNKDRHNSIQNFFLINDSTTIAVEVPVYLTHDDIIYYKVRHFLIKFLENYMTPITGHIDLIQIRNGITHILDYKPSAHKKEVQEQAIQQLTIYALALASRTKLALSDFKCAFFDENNYYEFFPLHVVYKKTKSEWIKVKELSPGTKIAVPRFFSRSKEMPCISCANNSERIFTHEKDNNQILNNFFKSFVLNISTRDCSLNAGSLDHIGQFSFNASANEGISLSCGASCLASDSNALYLSEEKVRTYLSNSSMIDSICFELNFEYLRRSDLLSLNSSILYAAVNNSMPNDFELMMIDLTGFSLKNENNMLVSTTNFIYHPVSLCLFQTRSFNLSPNFRQSSSVNSEFSSILSSFLSNNALLTFSDKKLLTDSDQFNSGNESISCFSFSGTDNVKFGILAPPSVLLNSVYPVEDVQLYKSFENSNIKDNNGNVGIGTTSPPQILSIESIDPIINFNDTDDNQIFEIRSRNDFAIHDVTDNVERFVIDGSGNVGINTTSPTAKLHVDGTFNATDSTGASIVIDDTGSVIVQLG